MGAKGENSFGYFTVGEMAALFNVNAKTLRYYDEIGLLKPEARREGSRYRLYSSNQFERMNTIKYLRALRVGIGDINNFFESRQIESMTGIFENQLADVRRQISELTRIERKIENRLAQIEEAVSAPFDAPQVKQLPKRNMVQLETRFRADDDLEPLIRRLVGAGDMEEAVFLGKVGVSVSREDLRSRDFRELSSIFIIVEEEDAVHVPCEVIPAGDYASLVFHGTHRDADLHYERLLDFCAAEGLEAAGPSIEVTVIDSGMTSDASLFATELQIPVGKLALS